MDSQSRLKQNYHEYLRIANELPTQMRTHGVFRWEVPIKGHDLEFSYEGTLKVDNSNPIPINSVDSILYACFSKEKSQGYKTKPLNLDQVIPEHMQILKNAIIEAQKSLDHFVFYKK